MRVSNEPKPKISKEANGMKVVLTYGYSNVWAAKPIEAIGSPERHPYEVRWTNALRREWGDGHHVIPEGLNNRTTTFDNEIVGLHKNDRS